jgi:hypothetical protein
LILRENLYKMYPVFVEDVIVGNSRVSGLVRREGRSLRRRGGTRCEIDPAALL